MKSVLQLVLIAAGLVLSGCTIAKRVTPAPAGTAISKIYVQHNEDVHMSGLAPEIVTQLNALGFPAELYRGQAPADAKHRIEFTANWRWDMAMYLAYFRATLIGDNRVLGTAEYDAMLGGANMGKFGKTAEKIRPLLQQLLSNARRQEGAAPMAAEQKE